MSYGASMRAAIWNHLCCGRMRRNDLVDSLRRHGFVPLGFSDLQIKLLCCRMVRDGQLIETDRDWRCNPFLEKPDLKENK